VFLTATQSSTMELQALPNDGGLQHDVRAGEGLSLVASSGWRQWNWSASVEPARAVVDEVPPEMTSATLSK
jgi:hypothetical protein